MLHKYHIGDQVIFLDNQFRPTLSEIIDIDAYVNADGLATRYLLTNGRHYQEGDLFPNRIEAKGFFSRRLKKIFTRSTTGSLA